VAHAEERREGVGDGPRARAGPRGEEKREGKRRVGCCSPFFLFLLFFFLSTLKPFKQIYLNSNKFEFKPYKLNTRKIMLQHECTNMLTL
jgi:hypothetical protein